MRVERQVTYYCDLCGKEISGADHYHFNQFPVVTDCDWNDGIPMREYIEYVNADFCPDCMLKATNVRCGFRGSDMRLKEGK